MAEVCHHMQLHFLETDKVENKAERQIRGFDSQLELER